MDLSYEEAIQNYRHFQEKYESVRERYIELTIKYECRLKELERLEETLKWYANERNYTRTEEEYFEGYPPEIMNDRGYKARTTLKVRN
jgi:hypothetical protein